MFRCCAGGAAKFAVCDGTLNTMAGSRFQVLLLIGVLSAWAAPPAAAAEEKRLFIYNWPDFIGPDTIAKFEKATGIKVTYDVYDAEETMEARLLAGGSGYDIVSASTDFFSREIKAGVFQSLDKSKLPNWGISIPEFSPSRAPTTRTTHTPCLIFIR